MWRNKESILTDVAGLRQIAEEKLSPEDVLSVEALLQDIEASTVTLPDSISLTRIIRDVFKHE